MPTEKPILFSGPMVRAILSGQKTVTRRPVKPGLVDRFDPPRGQADVDAGYPFVECDDRYVSAVKICPYGRVGDRLWIREAWAADAQVNAVAPRDLSEGEPIWYPANGAVRENGSSMITPGKTRPSIHMPRWTSRILLEITALRVERLQDGAGETALESRYIAEGINRIHQGDGDYAFHPFNSDPGPGSWTDPFDAWRELWVSVNGAESWKANPWVWVVGFKRVTQ